MSNTNNLVEPAMKYMESGSMILLTPADANETPFDAELLFHDPILNFVLLRYTSKSGKPNHYDVSMYNLKFVKDISVKKKPQQSPVSVVIDEHKFRQRKEKNCNARQKKISQMGVGVSEEAQLLFNYIAKVLGDEVSWDKQVMVVMKKVRVVPPYLTSDVIGDTDEPQVQECVNTVKKLIDRHYKNQKDSASTSASAMSAAVAQVAAQGDPSTDSSSPLSMTGG